MTVYVVGQLKFTDRAAYDRYAAQSPVVKGRTRCTTKRSHNARKC
jgi:hypothetical protein